MPLEVLDEWARELINFWSDSVTLKVTKFRQNWPSIRKLKGSTRLRDTYAYDVAYMAHVDRVEHLSLLINGDIPFCLMLHAYLISTYHIWCLRLWVQNNYFAKKVRVGLTIKFPSSSPSQERLKLS